MHQIGGVRWRGLRKNQQGFDPQPDLDHANVGKKLKKFLTQACGCLRFLMGGHEPIRR
jgi:hypothetical protein